MHIDGSFAFRVIARNPTRLNENESTYRRYFSPSFHLSSAHLHSHPASLCHVAVLAAQPVHETQNERVVLPVAPAACGELWLWRLLGRAFETFAMLKTTLKVSHNSCNRE